MNRAKALQKDAVTIQPAILKEATEVIIRHHYLHRGRTMAQVAYWIQVDDAKAGVALLALPRLSVVYHGYHPMALLELARLWIDPAYQGLQISDSSGTLHTLPVASRAIGLTLKRVRGDWSEKYPHLPPIEACVAWADLTHHSGTVYRATNFELVGTAGGKGPGRSPKRNRQTPAAVDYLNQKATYLYRWSRTRNCMQSRLRGPSDRQ